MKNVGISRLALLLVCCSSAARADESTLRITNAPAAAIVRANCSICHSIDYIPMNSPFLNKTAWDAEVHKMIQALGAPVPDKDVAAIVDYLTKYYGVQ